MSQRLAGGHARRLPIFEESNACRGGVHCATCRDRDGGRRWRESLSKAFTLPDDAPDFACPHARPWGWTPPAEPACQRCGGLGHAIDRCPIPAEYDVDRSPTSPRAGGCCGPPRSGSAGD